MPLVPCRIAPYYHCNIQSLSILAQKLLMKTYIIYKFYNNIIYYSTSNNIMQCVLTKFLEGNYLFFAKSQVFVLKNGNNWK